MSCTVYLLVLVGCLGVLSWPVLAQDNSTNSTDASTNNSTGNTTDGTPDTGSDAVPTELDQCSFSDLTGTWLSTVWGEVTFTDDKLKLPSGSFMISHIKKELQCHKSYDNGAFILQSKVIKIFTAKMYLYTCVKLEKKNDYLYRISIHSPRSEESNDLPAVVLGDATEATYDNICVANDTDVQMGYLIKQGHEFEGAMGCQDILGGRFNVSYEGVAADTCPDGAELSTCDNEKALVISHENCASNGTQDSLQDIENYICVASGGESKFTLLTNTTDGTFNEFVCLELTEVPLENMTLMVTRTSSACGQPWHLPESDAQPEVVTFNLTYTGQCPVEENTTPSTTDNSTMWGDNSTDTGNSTDSGNGTSGDGNSTDDGSGFGPEDAATSLASNGLLLTTLCALLAVMAANHPIWKQ